MTETTGTPIFDVLALQYYEEFDDELFTLRIDPSLHQDFQDPHIMPVWEGYTSESYSWEWLQWKHFSIEGGSVPRPMNPGDTVAEFKTDLAWVQYLPDDNEEFTDKMKSRMHSVFKPSENMKKSVSNAIDAMIDGPEADVDFFAQQTVTEIESELTVDSDWEGASISEQNQYISDAREEFAEEGNNDPEPNAVLSLAKMLFANDSLTVES